MGKRKHPQELWAEHTTWTSMLNRCKDLNNKYYGGVGVTVCERWQDFNAFFADVGPKPTSDHSLDRWPNPAGNYEPGNVRWATKTEQADNKRINYKNPTKKWILPVF